MIKNIILDFGAVLIPIEESRTWEAFRELGSEAELRDQKSIFEEYEIGKISTDQFLRKIQPYFFRRIFLPDLADAWNALLDPLPEEIVPFLKNLKNRYRIFLLSNTNDLHIGAIKQTAGPFLYNQFIKQFGKVYYSQEMGMRKPDTATFKKVLKDNDLKAEETFYVDDGKQHIEAAKKLGINCWHFKPGADDTIRDLDKMLAEHSN